MNAANELLTFIENSPSMFHSIETIKGMLDEAGFSYVPRPAYPGRLTVRLRFPESIPGGEE